MSALRLDIVTPSGSVYERENVEMTVLQTIADEMGIICDHIPTIAALEIGHAKVNFHNENGFIAISDGFIGAGQHQLSIIVQTAEPAGEIDVERARLAKSRTELHLEEDDDNTDISRTKRVLERANNRLRVAELQ